MKKRFLVAALAAIMASSAFAATTYEIEAADNDENFVINDEHFEAQTYCLGWDKGEHVMFLEGSAAGVCVTAVLFNVQRRETCEVWCE